MISSHKGLLGLLGLVSIFLATGCQEITKKTAATASLETKTAAVEVPRVLDPIRARFVTIGGRTVIGDDNDQTAQRIPLPGVKVTALVDGVRNDIVTDTKGFWSVNDIPVRWSGSAGADPGTTVPNVVVYFDLDGFQSTSRNFTSAILAAADGETPSARYQVDLGEITLGQQPLLFQSNIIRGWTDRSGGANNGTFTTWVGSNATVGGPNGTVDADSENVYAADPAAAITLTFNFPVDTARAGTQFLVLKSAQNVNLKYAGNWNATGTQFTITPAAPLVASPYRSEKHNISFDLPLWTKGTIYHQAALDHVAVNFNVMPSAVLPLATQAPALAPEVDALPDVLAYSFGYKSVLKKGIVNIGGLNDVLQSGALPIWLRYSTSPGMTNKVYYRFVPGPGWGPASNWIELPLANIAGGCTDGASYADSTATCKIADPIALTRDTFSYGESLQFIVTSLKNGEESVRDFATPLTITSTLKPFLIDSKAGWRLATSTSPRPEWGTNAITGRATIDFSEPMNANAPVLAALSGGLTAVAQNAGTGRWTSLSEYIQDLTLTFAIPASTLAEAHTIGQTRLKLTTLGAASSRFAVGDKVVIGNTAGAMSGTPWRETRTISAVDTRNLIITIDALTQSHAAAEAVLLLDSSRSNPGLTYFRSAITAPVRAGSYVVGVTAATGARFYPGQALQFLRQDPTGASGYLPAVTGVIDSITADQLTLMAPLTGGLPSGAVVMDAGVSQAEPGPRPAIQLASSDQVLFDTSAAVTTAIDTDQFATAPDVLPKEIDIGSTAGIYQGDVLTIAASALASTTASGAAGTVTLGSGNILLTATTAKDFRAGDQVELAGQPPLRIQVTAAAGAVVNAAGSTINLAASTDVRAGDILRFWEAQAITTTMVMQDASAGGVLSSVQVASTSGFAVGQTVTLDDRETAAVPVAVTSIVDATHISIAGLAPNRHVSIGTVLFKPEMADDVLPNGDTTGITPSIPPAGNPGGFATTSGYSTLATVYRLRPSRRVTVFSISGDTLVTTASAGGFPGGTPVSLVSEAEQFVVGKVLTPYAIQLVSGAGLQFAHRAGAQVTKATQTSFIVGAGQLDRVMVGDTIVIQRDTTVDPLARKERFQGTIAAIDSATGEVTIQTAQPGFYDFALLRNAEIRALGDAVTVTGHVSSNGLTAENAHGFRMSLGSQVAR